MNANKGAPPSAEEMLAALEARHGGELHKAFTEASVAICGLGGLGSNVALALARAGVGRLHLIDFDLVDISNLNRQQYNACQVGMAKTEAMKDNISAAAPYVELVTDTVRINDENAESLLREDDVICEAFDDPEAKAMLVNLTLERMPEKYVVAASGMAGLGSSNDIRTRRVAEKFYICGDGVSDIDDGPGLIAPRVMLCAAHQANMILRILAGRFDA